MDLRHRQSALVRRARREPSQVFVIKGNLKQQPANDRRPVLRVVAHISLIKSRHGGFGRHRSPNPYMRIRAVDRRSEYSRAPTKDRMLRPSRLLRMPQYDTLAHQLRQAQSFERASGARQERGD
jgi:hypothetical protein